MNWLAVFIGGGIGSLLRYGVSVGFKSWSINPVLGTFISNALASIILALVFFGVFKNVSNNSTLFLFITVGVAGGFSTFSTFSLENVMLFKSGQPYLALINIAVNVIICFLLVWLVSKRF